jgi:tRNA-dihydrouridine synthase B
LDAVVSAVDVPVTLKIRTGWDPGQRNAVAVAKLAEAVGIQALSVHGRTRKCGFSGHAEYHTIRMVKTAVSIPVIANGDIDSPEKARGVLEFTQADGVMIGRAALGRPWIFEQISVALGSEPRRSAPGLDVVLRTMRDHLLALYDYYGEFAGVRIARKHVGWYLQHLPFTSKDLIRRFNAVESASGQQAMLPDLLGFNQKGEAA